MSMMNVGIQVGSGMSMKTRVRLSTTSRKPNKLGAAFADRLTKNQKGAV